MFYYAISSFILSTLIFMMQGEKILTGTWLVCVILGVVILALLDKVFLDEIIDDDF